MNTPRTDAERRALKKAKSYPVDPVSAEFARKLETEIVTMRKAISNAFELLQGVEEHLNGNRGMFVQAALVKLKPYIKP